jgi:hypothetical protein
MEDNEDTSKALKRLFVPYAEVLTALTTDEARDHLLDGVDAVFVDYFMPTRSDPTPRGENTRDLLARHLLARTRTKFVACSKEHNEELKKWGCTDELPFAGMAGIDAKAFTRLVCALIGVPMVEAGHDVPHA